MKLIKVIARSDKEKKKIVEILKKKKIVSYDSVTTGSRFFKFEITSTDQETGYLLEELENAGFGKSFENGKWVVMTMTFDSNRGGVSAYLNGILTSKFQTDPVALDVFRYEDEVASNPFHFKWPVYSPKNFILKYNGYNVITSGIYEQWLEIDLNQNRIVYDLDYPENAKPISKFRINSGCIINKFDINHDVTSDIKAFIADAGIDHIVDIPYDTSFTEAMTVGKTIVEHSPDGTGKYLSKGWMKIKRLIQLESEKI